MVGKYHLAFGCYGIIGNQTELVVIKKLAGPYHNRYDLPGGSLEDGEDLEQTLKREVKEETGLTVTSWQQLGITSFKYPWVYEKWYFNHHFCVFYQVTQVSGQLAAVAPQFSGQDSLGAVKVPLSQLTSGNSSPLVLWARDYLQQPEQVNLTSQTFDDWQVLLEPNF